MQNSGYTGNYQYRPLSPWAYVGYTILFLIPVVGFIFLIAYSFSAKNINRRNFARSYWCSILLAVIILIVSISANKTPSFITGFSDQLNGLINSLTAQSDAWQATSYVPSSVLKGATPEFKEAMDSYEAFFDEYVAFIKKYNNTSKKTTRLLNDYASFLDKYADMMQKIDEIDEKKLSDADSAYYLEVTARIYKKLGDAI